MHGRIISVNPGRVWLAGVLMLALALRLYAIATQTYVVYLDETFQYFEQAHRLAFGSGIKPWEFFDGIRSWRSVGAHSFYHRQHPLRR